MLARPRQPVLFDARNQGAARDPEHARRGTLDAAGTLERFHDPGALERADLARQVGNRQSRCWFARHARHGVGQVLDEHLGALAEDGGALHTMPELADVAGPPMAPETAQGL